uniref:RIKEN cDNA 4933409G03 gene n=1 Tax=Mus musculus TaxID=10090 RepID=A0ABJ3HKN6_MOUSE
MTALHFACVYGHPEVVTLLVDSSCEISPKDIKDATPLIKNKITPLLLALKQNKEKMAEFLINNGANEKTCDFLGRSSLMYAVRCGSELIIKLLLQRDIDTFKQDVFGWTAKRYAVESKSKVRKLLIDYDEEELRQRCTETIRRDACIMPILPTREVKDSPQSEALEKTEARPSKSETTEEDTCIMPILPTTEVRDSPQSDEEDDIVEKAEARPSKSENTKTDACSMPTTTEVEDFHQDVAAEEAEANPSQSEPGLGVSPEEKAKTSDHNENNWSLDSGNSRDEEENSKDISKGRVLDLSVEEVIEVSSEEEQKGGDEEEDEDNDGDDEDGDDGDDEGGDDEDGGDEDGDDGDGGDDEGVAGQAQLVVEETKQSAGRSNQEDPSNKLSLFQEDEDLTEHSKGAATEQPLGKDEDPKSHRDEESDETTEEEETKPPLGQDKASIPQTDEDSTEDSEEEARKQPVEKCNQENYCQKTNNDKNFAQIFEDSSMDSEEEAAEQPVGKRNQRSPCKQMNNDSLTDGNSGDNTNNSDMLEDMHEDCSMLKHY